MIIEAISMVGLSVVCDSASDLCLSRRKRWLDYPLENALNINFFRNLTNNPMFQAISVIVLAPVSEHEVASPRQIQGFGSPGLPTNTSRQSSKKCLNRQHFIPCYAAEPMVQLPNYLKYYRPIPIVAVLPFTSREQMFPCATAQYPPSPPIHI